ncbi:MAG: acyl-CoA thioesterase [Chloroflexi bacterium]|nr:acyl-CoA thioesterase [Chloroflexota bacterium]
MGLVYNTNFLIWFEVGRTEYLRAEGFPYSRLEENEGLYLPVLDCACRFVQPAHYDDPITIRTVVREATRIKLGFGYRAFHTEGGQLLAEGHTNHVFTDRGGKPRRLSASSPLWRCLRELTEADGA